MELRDYTRARRLATDVTSGNLDIIAVCRAVKTRDHGNKRMGERWVVNYIHSGVTQAAVCGNVCVCQ